MSALQRVDRLVPALSWLRRYDRSWLRGDLSAGVTVGVMLIPQGMAYAMLAGLPPIYGLYAALVPLLLYALLGTSRQLAVGPVAIVALMVAAGVGTLAEPGTPEYIGLAILLALMVGAIQLAMGMLRMGFLVNFLSHPVVSGFTSAAALIIGLSQLQHLFGVSPPGGNQAHTILYHLALQLPSVHLPTLLIGSASIALLILLRRWRRTFPAQIAVVAAAVALVWGFGLHEAGVRIVGTVPDGLPSFAIPDISAETLRGLLPIALAIALVGFMESIAVAKAMVRRHRDYRLDANQELIALGGANLGGAFFQSFPVTGGFSRTAVNDQAGAKTGLASMVSAAMIAITLLFLTPLFTFLPTAVLAAVILVAVAGLIDVQEMRFLWRVRREDFLMLATTFLVTLFIGIEEGIATGVLLSLAMVIYRSTRPHVAVLGRLPGTDTYRNIRRFPEAEQRDDLLIVRFDAQLYFANVEYFQDTLRRLEREKAKPLRQVIIDAASMPSIDASGIHALTAVIGDYRRRGIALALTGVLGPVRDALDRAGVVEYLGAENFYLDVPEAIACSIDGERRARRDYTLQHFG
ncbi:Sulfate permease [Thioalkalivibrio nitratireducens DSM 14787]|uniref:Sulfate permease n=1 Tax=Thioalkalivibrio nitratireducens (strain DSM 14787 / UNIQEM 213 / ALEN2) TaxID=1255043 RepID=L0DWE9_THIND|nr:solute carrier family 26 protein [Thioalkalivibrio nitratireducens]AGA33342.1 Sulfate permease [Thioalkalivibrio nitratireducens DSM 14787]